MIGHSKTEYVFIRISIFLLRAIAPLSIAGVGYSVARWYNGTWEVSLASTALVTYAAIESAFYLLVYLPRRRRLQKPATHPPLLSRTERQALFAKCVTWIRDSSLALGWFHPSPASAIKKGNAIEWLLWALFYSQQDGLQGEWEEELHLYVKMLEDLMGRELEPGWDESVKCMKVTLDPVIVVHRPLIWYLVVCMIDVFTSFALYRNGFRHYSLHGWGSHFPPRLFPILGRASPHPHVSYWYRPHRSSTKQPILFIHGIGIGLWTYISFLSEIIVADPDVGIIAIENLNISMRISPPPLGREEMLSALTQILDFHGLPHVTVAGHSYGTVLAAHILRDPVLSTRVSAWLLVDPIPFLLHLPAVAYNFVYRQPRTANEWQLWYFASRDPDIARFLARHFFWADNILWKDDLEGKAVGIVLSERDQIVDVVEVWRYLTGEDEVIPRWKKNKLEVLFCPDLDHSMVFDTRRTRQPLVEMTMNLVTETPEAGDPTLRSSILVDSES